ncbi:type II toxin-antitoxin system Phd/YefM family antitoxin [Mariprofundus sp. EBB-1]|uniref:type II toxin-antitoxin system Phd/YefM family antitoxin n=1 Tax=Mariprofundus sp. EBB-1 TaxID=2650971 RepID=UPI000EF23DCD|nr:type II toxin-antitoxin system Phd/YefM family antitoxin [Mariprofundus sp. EBB-1]RLL54030.1 type II toxin-antitoxin system Phd/YefM family antitoxin [Mariprofundus sp. EBB-1]
MIETSANEFRQTLKAKVDDCINNHDVLKVRRRHGGDFVVLGADDWRAVEETLYLNQFSGLVDSIHQANDEPLSEGTSLENLDL